MPHSDVSGVLASSLPYILLQTELENLFGGSNRCAASHISLMEEQCLGRSSSLSAQLREGCTWKGEEGDTCLASQISQMHPGYQWSDLSLPDHPHAHPSHLILEIYNLHMDAP